jgi:glycine hydroxymethyltransferase
LILNFDTLKQLLANLKSEELRSSNTLHLTAYENRLSKLAQSFLSSNLSFRQLEGTLDEHSAEAVILHGSFVLMGLPAVFELEKAANEAAKTLFHAELSDFRPVSGLHGLLCVLASVTDVGDLVYSIDPLCGGHSATRNALASLGRQSEFLPWSDTEVTIDMDRLSKDIKARPPKAIVFEYGTPLFNFPLREIRDLVGEDVALVYDASHTLGLIAGGKFQDPLKEGANILQGNTHKTFPGPQKGMIHFRDRKEGLRVARNITSGLVSNQHAHHSIALYITMLEMQEFAGAYAQQMLLNAKVLAERLAEHGFELIARRGEFTNSHQVAICGEDMDGQARRLFACGISTNVRYSFNRRIIRLGVQEVTRRGMGVAEMEYIADLFKRIIFEKEPVEAIKKDVGHFNDSFKNIAFSFDTKLGLGQVEARRNYCSDRHNDYGNVRKR